MIAAFDAHYPACGCVAAAVLFSDYRDAEPKAEYSRFLPIAADYIPGEFFKRELPSILALLEQIVEKTDELIVDGYVMLGNRPGLGQHLFEALACKIPVIGVAKSRFKGASGAEVFRGRSRHSLYVTAAGTDLQTAAESIRQMHGPYRIPTLLKRVDMIARETSKKFLRGEDEHFN